MSTYCVQADIENVFGIENVLKWSDIENVGSINATRITQSIAVASERIDDEARVMSYKIPLQDEDDNASVTITDLAATLAGIWLYEARGAQDYNPQTGEVVHRFEFKRQRAEQLLSDIRDQRIRINAL